MTFSLGNPNLRNILVKLDVSDNFVELCTITRSHGRRGRFLIERKRFDMWLQDLPFIEDEAIRDLAATMHSASFFDTDCGHFLKARRVGERIRFEATWLSTYDNGDTRGIIQQFDVPVEQLRDLLTHGTKIRMLHAENDGCARVSCKNASKTIQRIRADKMKAHAFRKAMRDCFSWKRDVVTLYPDGRDDFYFTAKGEWPLNGGLILHKSTIKTPRGEYPKIYYSVHT